MRYRSPFGYGVSRRTRLLYPHLEFEALNQTVDGRAIHQYLLACRGLSSKSLAIQCETIKQKERNDPKKATGHPPRPIPAIAEVPLYMGITNEVDIRPSAFHKTRITQRYISWGGQSLPNEVEARCTPKGCEETSLICAVRVTKNCAKAEKEV